MANDISYDDIFSFQAIPRSVILINWMLCLIVIGGSRVCARWVFSDVTNLNKSKKNNVIVYGAGLSGRELSNSLQLSNEYLWKRFYLGRTRSSSK